MNDIRIIGFRRSNKNRTSDVYIIRECDYCHAILEFPSNIVKSKTPRGIYTEYIYCSNCGNEVYYKWIKEDLINNEFEK